MKHVSTTLVLLCLLALVSGTASAQTAFYNANNRLTNPNRHSGCAITVIDVNGDGLDDIVRLDGGHDLYFELQNGTGQFQEVHIGDFGGGSAWGMCVADVDHNGWKDVLIGGGTTKIMKVNSTGTGGTVYTMPSGGFFMQNANFVDVDNDGYVDVFACDDNAPAHLWLNDGTGNFIVSNMINFAIHPWNIGNDPADSGNYGSVWSDVDNDGYLDLHIAKCRQSTTDPTDPRRIDVLFHNNGNGTFTEQAAARGLADSNETWTTNFADFDNDGKLDAIKTHENTPPRLLHNDGNGYFSNVTANSGFNLDIFPIESVMEDFDNDGFVDILVTGDDARFFHNNGNGTFAQLTGLFDNNHMESFAIGDLNHDGFMDVYAGYGNIYTTPTGINDVVWLNQTNSNHYFNLILKGTVSNPDAIGARAFIYGPWGVQLRENHSGESYGTANSLMLHYGLGSATTIDSVVIKWPSGISQTILNPMPDQFMTVIESNCVSPNATLTVNGPLVFCPGAGATTFQLPAGHQYLWNNGATSQSFSPTQSGTYYASVSDPGNTCIAITPAVTVTVNPDATPTVTTSGSPVFCPGGIVTLQGPPGLASYTWSNGATTQDITVSTPGNYTLTTPGMCQNFTSAPVAVTLWNTPDAVVTNDTVNWPGHPATLTAIGDSIVWYDAMTGGNIVGTGTTFTTTVNSTTTFYAENIGVHGGGVTHGGITTSSGQYSGGGTTNALMFFDVMHPGTLESVKVYTDHFGVRDIELRDASGALLDSALVNVTASPMVVTLNFPLTPGTNYTLGTNATVNQALWGNNGPRFQREGGGVNYPYNIDSTLSITNSDQGLNYYYYFYDWVVKHQEQDCIGNLVPVTAYLIPNGIADLNTSGVSIYPNPANTTVYLSRSFNDEVLVTLMDVTGRMVRNYGIARNGSSVQPLDITGLAAGMYNVKVKTNRGEFITKLVVQD